MAAPNTWLSSNSYIAFFLKMNYDYVGRRCKFVLDVSCGALSIGLLRNC